MNYITTNPDKIIAPIIIVGTNRSGKSLLARGFNYLEKVYWWQEPNAVWRTGIAYGADDRRSALEATKRIRSRIRRHFLRKQKAQDNRRIIDDSPLHCLSVPFVRSVFPEAKLIHVCRDGRDVICDILDSWQKPAYSAETSTLLLLLVARLKQTPISEWPSYVPRVIGGLTDRVLHRKSTRQRHGVRYPGIRQDIKTMSNIELACKLWRLCQEYALNDLADCPDDAYVSIAYENFVRDPVIVFSKLLEFVEEPMNDQLYAYLRTNITTEHIRKWDKCFHGNSLDDLSCLLEPTLSRINKLIYS